MGALGGKLHMDFDTVCLLDDFQIVDLAATPDHAFTQAETEREIFKVGRRGQHHGMRDAVIDQRHRHFLGHRLIAVRDNAADMAQRAVAAMCPVNRNRLVLHDSPRPPMQGSFRPCCKYDTLYIIAKQAFCITLELSYAAYRIPAHPIECIGSRKHPALHNPVERHR